MPKTLRQKTIELSIELKMTAGRLPVPAVQDQGMSKPKPCRHGGVKSSCRRCHDSALAAQRACDESNVRAENYFRRLAGQPEKPLPSEIARQQAMVVQRQAYELQRDREQIASNERMAAARLAYDYKKLWITGLTSVLVSAPVAAIVAYLLK